MFAYDLSKAYNTMKTGIVERHLRRFIWKFREEDPWIDLAIDAVHSEISQLLVSSKFVRKRQQSSENILTRKLL